MHSLVYRGNSTENLASGIRVGLTYQWEMLDCFLSPHTCTTAQTVQGVTNFLNAAKPKETRTPVQITLDTVQFWYASNLWNWFDGQRGVDWLDGGECNHYRMAQLGLPIPHADAAT